MRRFSSPGDRPTDRPKRRRLLIIRPASSRPRARRRPSIRPSARRPRARDLCARTYSPRASVASRRVARRLANHPSSHRASPRMRGWVSHLSRVSRARARVHHLARDSAQGNYVSTHPARESTSTTSRARRTNASLDDAAAPPRSGGKRTFARAKGGGTEGTRGRVMTGGGRTLTFGWSITKDVVTVDVIFLECGYIDGS